MATQTQFNSAGVVRATGKAALAEVPIYKRNMTREPHALSRAPVLAREATVLRLDSRMGEAELQRVVASWNVVLRNSYPGCGYFAEHPHQAGEGEKRIFVLLADEAFYRAYMTGEGTKDVEAITVSAPRFSSIPHGAVMEEIVMTALPGNA